MCKMRCRLIGSGTLADPFRVNWPTYRLLEIDYASKIAIIACDHRDMPAEAADGFRHPDNLPINAPPRVIPPALLAQLFAHLDARYAEWAGRFRPQVI